MDGIMEDTKSDSQKAEKTKLRRWILKAASTESAKSGISWLRIKKFVDSKQAGLAEKPEAKEILKNLIETGLITKINRNYALNPKKKSGKKASKKNEKKTSAKKNAKKMSAEKTSKKISAK